MIFQKYFLKLDKKTKIQSLPACPWQNNPVAKSFNSGLIWILNKWAAYHKEHFAEDNDFLSSFWKLKFRNGHHLRQNCNYIKWAESHKEQFGENQNPLKF